LFKPWEIVKELTSNNTTDFVLYSICKGTIYSPTNKKRPDQQIVSATVKCCCYLHVGDDIGRRLLL